MTIFRDCRTEGHDYLPRLQERKVLTSFKVVCENGGGLAP